jgi:hypothetical protein
LLTELYEHLPRLNDAAQYARFAAKFGEPTGPYARSLHCKSDRLSDSQRDSPFYHFFFLQDSLSGWLSLLYELSERLSKWLSLFSLFLSYQNGYLNGYHFFRSF